MYNKEYYDSHKGAFKKYQRKYYVHNRIKFKNKHKTYYQQNREKIINNVKAYQQKNKDSHNEYHKNYYQENKEVIKQTQLLKYYMRKYGDWYAVTKNNICKGISTRTLPPKEQERFWNMLTNKCNLRYKGIKIYDTTRKTNRTSQV